MSVIDDPDVAAAFCIIGQVEGAEFAETAPKGDWGQRVRQTVSRGIVMLSVAWEIEYWGRPLKSVSPATAIFDIGLKSDRWTP